MTDSEKKIEAKLVELIKSKGGLCIKVPAGFYNGFPDRMVLLPNAQTFFVEVKTTGKEPTPLQKKVHKDLAKLGFIVLVIDKLEHVKRLSEII